MLFFATCVSLDNLCKKLKTTLFLILFNYYFFLKLLQLKIIKCRFFSTVCFLYVFFNNYFNKLVILKQKKLYVTSFHMIF